MSHSSSELLPPSSALVQVLKCLATLQIEVENFALRMAAEFPQRREQLVFLINNYDMMLGVLMVCACVCVHGHVCVTIV